LCLTSKLAFSPSHGVRAGQFWGFDVGNFTDKDEDSGAADGPMMPGGEPHNPGRRHFSLAALAGGAVLLSLGNRAAWGGGSQTLGCMSVATLNSFNPNTNMFISAPAGRPEHNAQMAAEIHRISDAPNFMGTDGKLSTCQDPNSLDSVCIVKGSCPR
jgi:hypothetical protein